MPEEVSTENSVPPGVPGTIIAADRRSLPMQHHPNGRIDMTVVLARGEVDVAAYRGIGDDWFIARSGDKLTYAEARAHFPYLPEAWYRR